MLETLCGTEGWYDSLLFVHTTDKDDDRDQVLVGGEGVFADCPLRPTRAAVCPTSLRHPTLGLGQR